MNDVAQMNGIDVHFQNDEILAIAPKRYSS